MKAKITKRMLAGDEQLEVGDIVDVTNWRNKKALVGARYIEILEDEPKTVEILETEEKPKKKTSKAKAE